MTAVAGSDVGTRLAAIVGAAGLEALSLPEDGRGRPGELPLALPGDEAQAVELLRLAARDGLLVLPCGLGSKLGWCTRPERADFALTTRRMAGIVDYQPGDGTLTARAGTTIAALAAAAREGGHHVSPDVPRPARATLGGVVAAGESGADRLRHGPLRHQVLGTKVALGDGTVAKSGGRLVKNVTGFDLHRLHAGSHGSLCLVLEVSLRLYPGPEHECVLLADARTSGEALELARAALALPVRARSASIANAPAAGGSGPWALAVALAGKREVVDAERAAIERVVPGARALEGSAARALAEERRDAFATAGLPWLEIGCLPRAAADALAALEAAALDQGLAPRIELHPSLARIDAALPTREGTTPDPHAVAALVRRLRGSLRAESAASVVLRDGGAAYAELDPFGEPGPGLALSRRLQEALDPLRVFARGRFHGGT